MEFIKEKDYIVAYHANEMMGKWHITTGNFIGKSNKPVKTIPQVFTYNNLTCNNIFARVIYMYRMNESTYKEKYTRARANRLEQLISVGLVPESFSALDSSSRLTKELVSFIKDNYNGMYSDNAVAAYNFSKNYPAHERFPDWAKKIARSIAYHHQEIPGTYVISILQRMILENVDSFSANIDDNPYVYYAQPKFEELIINYYKMSIMMYNEVKVPHNFLTAYAKMVYLYKIYKQENYDSILTKNNDKPFLYFQYRDYEARPILNKEAFHIEAKAQENCVEDLYMSKVFHNETYIVTVRKISAPDTPCITCEVSHKGKIIQYLTRFNADVTDPAQKQFAIEYQNHLEEFIK